MNVTELAKACSTFIIDYVLSPDNLELTDINIKRIYELLKKHFGAMPREEVLPALGINITEVIDTEDKFG